MCRPFRRRRMALRIIGGRSSHHRRRNQHMSRVIRLTAVCGLALAATVLCAQDGPQKATIKKVDAEKSTITLTVGAQDRTFQVTPDTRLKGADRNDLAKRLQSPALKPGAAVMFVARDVDGKQVLVGMLLQGPGGGGPPLVKVDSSGLKPLMELTGTERYQGYAGGLYGNGKNERPAAHEAAGVALARQVRPRDSDAKPAADGRIV